MPDYRTPSPDAGHEAIRKPLADAIDELADHSTRLDDAFLLAETTADFAQSTLDAITTMQTTGHGIPGAVAALQTSLAEATAAIADLTSRVAALEAASPTPDPNPVTP